ATAPMRPPTVAGRRALDLLRLVAAAIACLPLAASPAHARAIVRGPGPHALHGARPTPRPTRSRRGGAAAYVAAPTATAWPSPSWARMARRWPSSEKDESAPSR